MPCATIHLAIADRVLAEWSTATEPCPFDLEHPGVRAAFLHGALAPDMGFIPGVDRFVSDLAHYVRAAELSRALLARARDSVDTAFSWGWITHLVADQELHPVVGRAVGERLHGDRRLRVDAAADTPTHVSVEVGIDIAFHTGDRSVPNPPAEPHFDPHRIDHLVGALEDTYGPLWDARTLLADHRRAVRLGRWWPRALSLLTRAGCETPRDARASATARMAAHGLRLLGSLAGQDSAARGFFMPARPPSWVLREFDDVIAGFTDRFSDIAAAGPSAIPDRNLETGGPAGAGHGHPASDGALDLLRRRSSDARAGTGVPQLRGPLRGKGAICRDGGPGGG